MFKNIERKQGAIDDFQRALMEQQQRMRRSQDTQDSLSQDQRLFSSGFHQSVQRIEVSLSRRRKLEFDAMSVSSLLSRFLQRHSESAIQLSEISLADPSISILKETPSAADPTVAPQE